MTYTITPRTLVYKDNESINYFLGDKTERTLEQVFYDRLIECQFITKSNNPPKVVLSILNNARYIYYLVKCEENSPSLSFNIYLTKAAEGIEVTELKGHITAATMALLYNWLCQELRENGRIQKELSKNLNYCLDESADNDIQKLCEKIFLHYSEDGNTVTAESIKYFHTLLLNKTNLPTIINTLSDDIRDIEDAAFNAPIQDVAKGIDYLLKCYDPQNGTNGEHYLFLNKILKRFENEMYPDSDAKTIENAKAIIHRRLNFLELTAEPEHFTLGLSLDNIVHAQLQDDIITPEIQANISWIIDRNKATDILKTLWHFMEGRTKPKDLLMPLCAALEVGLIRKPTFQEYKVVFKDHIVKSESSFDEWVDSGGARRYKRGKTNKGYCFLLEEFQKIGNQ